MERKTLKRSYRSRRLSAHEAARDEELRHKIQAEFPPLEGASASDVLSGPLKDAIAQSRKSVRQLAKDAQVSSVVLTQFLEGKRDLRLATAEKLARVLGLKLLAS